MKLIISIFLLINIVSVSLGSLSQSLEADPKNPDNCLVEGKSYPPGIHRNPSETSCYRVECHKGGHAEIADCGVQVRSKCKNGGYLDVSLPYPECCAIKWICADD